MDELTPQLNWAKIKEENPKAFEALLDFIIDWSARTYNFIPYSLDWDSKGLYLLRTDGVHSVGVVTYIPDRICYDFFDSKGIYVQPNQVGGGEFWEWVIIDNKNWEVGNSDKRGKGIHEYTEYKSRPEAESAAFTRAFQILNSQIQSV